MLHEEGIERDPVPHGDRSTERLLRLLGPLGPDDPEPVCDAVHVGVDRDRRDSVAKDEDAVRRLGPHPGQARQLRERPRHRPPKALEERASVPGQDSGLRAIEADRPDQRFDVGWLRPSEELHGRISREQPRARGIGRLVPCPLRENRADQHLERVFGMVP